MRGLLMGVAGYVEPKFDCQVMLTYKCQHIKLVNLIHLQPSHDEGISDTVGVRKSAQKFMDYASICSEDSITKIPTVIRSNRNRYRRCTVLLTKNLVS